MLTLIKYSIIICSLTVIFCTTCFANEKDDLSRHPVYSTYKFGKEASVIDIALQPISAPVGVIGEVLKRDRALKKSLTHMGMEVRFHPMLKGPDINFFVKRGELDAALSGETPTLTLATVHDILLTALAKQSYSGLVARDIKELKDIKGKRIGYVEGTTAHLSLLIAMSAAGMKETDADMVPMEINELAGALESGKIDAFSAWEPLPTSVLSKHRDYILIQQFLNSSYFFFTKSFTERSHEAALQVIASYLRAARWLKKDRKNLMTAAGWCRKAASDLQKKPFISTENELADITDRDFLRIASTPYVPLQDFDKTGMLFKAFEFLQLKGMIDKAVTWEKVKQSLDRSIMSEVAGNQAKYRLDEFDYE